MRAVSQLQQKLTAGGRHKPVIAMSRMLACEGVVGRARAMAPAQRKGKIT